MPRYIDADALKDKYLDKMVELIKCTTSNMSEEALSLLCGNTLINDMPTANVVERKKGKWVLIGSGLESRPFACSECNYAFQVDTVMGKTAWNFCPNCGAEMEANDDRNG